MAKISTDIITMELKNGEEIMEQYGEEEPFTEYSEVSEMTERLKVEAEKLVKDQKLPAKDIIGQVGVTEMVIDISMASLAKQTSIKILKLEKYLGKVEDRLFKDDALDNMSKTELSNLYASTRMMRTDAFKMLKEIKKDVDFASLEANLLSLHAKKSLEDDEGVEGSEKTKSILETLLLDADFLDAATQLQTDTLNKTNKED